ncbi:MAG TPA: M67 family metallopeptidase [Acidimicrobiia bacterium]|jgi:proteasome lid subunit RPN8/RPN11|nr:M67 family metallopeptidase [Acidimicrobiia bacterium]
MNLSSSLVDEMVEHARACFPNEACGLLVGSGRASVVTFHRCANVDASPSSFTIDPTDHYRAMKQADGAGMEITGVFHSHTHSAPYPSPTDRRQASDPEWVHLILGMADVAQPELRAWWLEDGKLTEEPLVVE